MHQLEHVFLEVTHNTTCLLPFVTVVHWDGELV